MHEASRCMSGDREARALKAQLKITLLQDPQGCTGEHLCPTPTATSQHSSLSPGSWKHNPVCLGTREHPLVEGQHTQKQGGSKATGCEPSCKPFKQVLRVLDTLKDIVKQQRS
jgi:hypothetical protein